MKHIKRGRGPSFMGGVANVLIGLFGVIVCFASGDILGILFGMIFAVIAGMNAVYNFKNASGDNRYSEYDIVDAGEEPDPLTPKKEEQQKPQKGTSKFCPYCGTEAGDGYLYCKNCGKKLP